MEIVLCNYCKFYMGNLTCLAFPNGIPEDILLGENNHSKPIAGQVGDYVFVDTEDDSKDVLDFA